MIRLACEAGGERRPQPFGSGYRSPERIPSLTREPLLLFYPAVLPQGANHRPGRDKHACARANTHACAPPQRTDTGAHACARGPIASVIIPETGREIWVGADHRRSRHGAGTPHTKAPQRPSQWGPERGRKRGWRQPLRTKCFSKIHGRGCREICRVTCQRSLVALGKEPASALLLWSLAGRGRWKAGPLPDGQMDFGVYYWASLVDRPYGQGAGLGKGILRDRGHFLFLCTLPTILNQYVLF